MRGGAGGVEAGEERPGQPEAGGGSGGDEPGAQADDAAERRRGHAEAGGAAGDSLPFDGGEPGPANGHAPGTGDTTDR